MLSSVPAFRCTPLTVLILLNEMSRNILDRLPSALDWHVAIPTHHALNTPLRWRSAISFSTTYCSELWMSWPSSAERCPASALSSSCSPCGIPVAASASQCVLARVRLSIDITLWVTQMATVSVWSNVLRKLMVTNSRGHFVGIIAFTGGAFENVCLQHDKQIDYYIIVHICDHMWLVKLSPSLS